jgi:hypothetical protein
MNGTGTVSKPDANPMVAALLTAFVLMLGHLIVNGQQRKWLFNLLANFIGTLLCCVPGIVVLVLSVMDSYKTAQRLQAGEVIGENEYSEPLLFKIVSKLDSTATCSKV